MAAPHESLVCIVERTRCPVSEACTEAFAVSASRISPIMMMSGSWRSIARSPAAKSRPTWWLTGIWLTPGTWYSTGSSTVIALTSLVTICLSDA